MSDRAHSVLLVIPESRERSQISLLIRELDYSIHICPDPSEAIQELSKNTFSLAIVDQEQPGFSGVELVRQMRRLRTQCHIVLLATEDSSTNKDLLNSSGASEIIFRPIQPRRLSTRLQILMKKPLPPMSAAVKKAEPASPMPSSGSKPPMPVPDKSEGLTLSPFQSVSSESYHPTYLVGSSGATIDLMRKIWHVRMFKHTLALTGETGTEFELVAREINTMSGCAQQFPIVLQPDDLQDDDYLNTLQAQAELRGRTGPMVLVEDAAGLDAKQRGVLFEYLEKNMNSTKRQLRFVIAFTDAQENYSAEAWAWMKKVKAMTEAAFDIVPLRDRPQDVRTYARKLFYDITNIHPFLGVRVLEDASLDCLCNYTWPGNFMQLITVMRSAMANCHGRSLTLHQIQPHLVEEDVARHLMESVADEKLLYPDFAANG